MPFRAYPEAHWVGCISRGLWLSLSIKLGDPLISTPHYEHGAGTGYEREPNRGPEQGNTDLCYLRPEHEEM
jgi:hypothetical protein